MDAWFTIANVIYALVLVGFPPLDAQQLFLKVVLDKAPAAAQESQFLSSFHGYGRGLIIQGAELLRF